MYKINGENDEMRPIKESFRKYIEKRRADFVNGYPDYLKKKMMENFEKEDRKFIESLQNKNLFVKIDVKKYKSDYDLQDEKQEPENDEVQKDVCQIIEEKMKKFIANFEKKWGSKFK